jgi:soluble lytic murein transglycosylase
VTRGRRALLVATAAVAGFLLGRLFPTRRAIADARDASPPDLARFEREIDAAAAESRVDPDLLRGLVAAESGGNPNARSRAGAVGLLQLRPDGAADAARSLSLRPPYDLLDPATNLRLGARLLALRLGDFGGDRALALAAYNAGKSNVLRWRLRAPDVSGADAIAREAYAETRRHVTRTLRFASAYRAR